MSSQLNFSVGDKFKVVPFDYPVFEVAEISAIENGVVKITWSEGYTFARVEDVNYFFQVEKWVKHED